MKTNEYLYGNREVPEIPAEIIVRRIEELDDHLTELQEVHFSERDSTRVKAVKDAIEFWETINDK